LPIQQQQSDLQTEKAQPQLAQSDLQLVGYGDSQVQYHEAAADWVLPISPQPNFGNVAEEQAQTNTYDIGKAPTHTDIQMSVHLPTPTTFDHGKNEQCWSLYILF